MGKKQIRPDDASAKDLTRNASDDLNIKQRAENLPNCVSLLLAWPRDAAAADGP